MLSFFLRRAILAVSVLVATLVASFLLFFAAPTDPAAVICGDGCRQEQYESIKKGFHLDEPIPEQLWGYSKGIFAGRTFTEGGYDKTCERPCFGFSFKNDEPVWTLIKDALPISMSLILGAAVVFLTFGVFVGSMAARRRGSPADRALVGTTLVLSSIPYYIVALLVFLYGVLQFGILPRPEWVSPMDNPAKWFIGMLTPWLVLGIVNSTAYARYSRGSMIESLSEDYVRTARSKGLSERRVVFRHGLRAAITPVITLLALDLAALLAGSVFTESVFQLQGLGNLTLAGFRNQDLPVLMGTTIVGAIVLVTMNLLVDVIYSLLDPRVRLA